MEWFAKNWEWVVPWSLVAAQLTARLTPWKWDDKAVAKAKEAYNFVFKPKGQ